MEQVGRSEQAASTPIRVLYVGADAADATSTELEATAPNLTVTPVTGGYLALKHVYEEPYDCVVSEYRLPEFDGLDLLASVRELEPSLPFILYPDAGSEQVASDAIEAGVSDYLQKGSSRAQVAVLANRIESVVARHRAERRFEAFVESTPDGVLVVAGDGTITWTNDRLDGLFGYDSGELLGEPVETLVPERDRAAHAALREQYVAEPEPRPMGAGLGLQGVRKGGTEFPVDVSLSPLDGPGRAAVLAVVRDRSAHPTLESVTLDRITDGLLAVDESWEITYVNQRAARFLERDVDALVGRLLWEEFSEATATAFADAFKRAMATQATVDVDAYYEPLGRWFEARAHPSETGLSIYFRDVTDQRERELRYEAIFNHTYQFTGLLEPDGTLLEANETMLAFGGLDREAVVGKKLWEAYWFQYEDAAPVAREAVERARDGEFVREEVDVQGAEDVVTIDFSIRPVFDDQDEVALLVPEGRDITEMKERERELERQNERLDEFASVVSHDLRNPMFVANGGVSLAKQTGDLEHLEKVERALDRMDTLIDDLLQLAREGQTVQERKPVDLHDAVLAGWRNVRHERATLDVAIGDARLLADCPRLEQLLENLFVNTIEHGGDDATVTVGTFEDGFYVADDGPGIPPGERESVFEHGYTTSDDGTGFGLAIVRGIAEAHGWEIVARESEAGGARFEVSNVDWA